MFPTPERRRWSRSASPICRDAPAARSRATIASRSGGSASTSGPSRATAGERPRVSSSTGPFQSTAWRSRPRRTSHGVPKGSVPAACTRQRPCMRRWLRRSSPPSKLRSRFLPTASTRSRRRPSSRSERRSTAARGWGVSTATTSPSRTRRRSAARWSASPSGIAGACGHARRTARRGPARKPASRRSGMTSVSPTGLAVEALDGQALQSRRPRMLDERGQRRFAASPPPDPAAARASVRHARRRARPRRRAGRRGRRRPAPRAPPSAWATRAPRRTAGRDRPPPGPARPPPPASRAGARPRRGARTARRRALRRSTRDGRRRASRACAARGRPARTRPGCPRREHRRG